MASFRKVKTGYQATVYAGLNDDGTQDRRYVTRPTLKECKQAVREIEQEIEEGNTSNIGNIRVVTLIKEYIDLNKGRLAKSTYSTYKLYLRVHYEPFFKNKKVKDIGEIDIRKFMAHQSQKVYKGKELSPTTVRKHVSVLNKIFEERLKNKNPARFIKLPKKAKYIPLVPTNQEFMEIHSTFKNIGIREEIITLLAGWCGMRRGEIFAIKPDDVYKNRRVIRVDESYTINEDSFYEDGPPKSDNGFREVAIPNYLMNLIQEYLKSLGGVPERLFDLRPDYWSEKFHLIIIKNNLAPVRFHDLRHYHASWLYKNGILDHKAADRIGDDIRTLKQVYQHIGVDDSTDIDEEIRQKLESTLVDYKSKAKGYRIKIKRTMQKSMA